MKFKYNKLRGRIVEVFGSQNALAKYLGVSEQLLTAKLAGRVKFSQEDIFKWCSALNIEQNEVGVYFFSLETSEN